MHERSLVRQALRRVEQSAREAGARRVVAVRLSVGGLSGLSTEHLRRGLTEAARGTVADGAMIEVRDGGIAGPGGDGLRVESIEIEEAEPCA